ncbi:flavoprotein [Mycena sp. CBHHK59/15]|nr:flavoprotein [Mycena sp. CBHHK59/15]
MSLQTLAVLPEAELKDGQMKEVAFGTGKVLLSRLGDKVHATSAFCTHYGAPLAKGVLTADGRVVWYACSKFPCFNVCTGDIEDAPAPDALHSFQVQISDGQIHVTARSSDTEKANLARAPKLTTATETSGSGVVIVGGGSATFHAVESLRELVLIVRSPLITDASKIEYRSAADLKIKYGTNMRVDVTVTSVDFAKKEVILDGGKDSVTYDKLILAPGGVPRKLPVPGAELDNVYTVRGVDSQETAQEGKRMVVIGSSFISMGSKASIDVIGMEEHPFELVLGKEVGKALQKYHESQGVKFHMSSKVEKIVPSEADASLAGGVVFLKESGMPLEKDGGVKVDETLKVPGYDAVYAVGDIAHYPQVETGEFRRIEHWNVAGNQGRAVGKTIAGSPQPFLKVPIFWSAQGQNIRYCGIGSGYDDIFIKGNVDELKFIAYYIKSGKVVAVATTTPSSAIRRSFFGLELMPTPAELRAGKDPLTVDISSVSSLKKV